MEGWLEKDGKSVMGFGGGFQERYFKLEDSVLTYWESRDSMHKEPKGQIDVRNAVDITMDTNGLTINLTAFDQKDDDKEQRTYHIKAAVPTEAKRW